MKKINKIALLEPSVAAECVVTELRSQIRCGAPFLAGALMEKGYSARVFAEEIMYFDDVFLDRIAKEYEVVGISVALNTLIRGFQVAKALKKKNSNILIAFGGPSASAWADKLLTCSDAVFRGRAEISFPDWLDSLNNSTDAEIPGLVIARNGQIKRNLEDPQVGDGSTRYDLIEGLGPYSQRINLFGGLKETVYSIFASTGCVRKCKFCKSEKRYNKRSIERVVQDFENIMKIHSGSTPAGIMLVDDCLFGDIGWIKELLKRLEVARDGRNVKFSAQFHVQPTADNELMLLFKKAGFVTLAIGFETNNQTSLDHELKGTRADENDFAILQCRKFGIVPYGYFIAGFDTDTEESVNSIFDYIMEKNLIAQVLPMGLMNRDEFGNPTPDAERILSDISFGATIFVSHIPKLMKPSKLQEIINRGYKRITSLKRISRFQTNYERAFLVGLNRCYQVWSQLMENHENFLKDKGL
ncbi:MAG: hypothetical protein HQM08_09460 [Candidatus Riflebacteria bacterium]|nr:hypothetical protein [Candidatus Riflebacteria bacterium]